MTLRDEVMRVVQQLRYFAQEEDEEYALIPWGYWIDTLERAIESSAAPSKPDHYLADMLEYVRSEITVALERANNADKPEDVARAILQAAINVFASQAAPQPTIPPGWKLVPVELTTEMMEEALGMAYFNPDKPDEDIEAVWKAMLAAAPSLKETKDGN